MRKDIIEYIRRQKQLQQFLHDQPHWYRRLARNPNELQTFEISALHYYKKTIPHQVERISNGVQMASMMMSMFQAMNNGQS
ncbi:YlbE-like family protein [Bacillus dakarensis]|uniref:YlbE-like family protein n=1 Tax=Robertmurraya dakarensis TaxID=1926278 RepID=UPI000980BB9D|nr:YlbE-like family protein [Bacillus dakarensis]